MKVRQAIELARVLKQIDQVNYPDLLMLQFLNECEGKLQTEFLHVADVDCQRYTEDDMEMDLIVGPPHDKLYYAYLCAMIDFTNGEYAKYNNSIIVANAFMAEWAAWFNRTHERDGRQYLGVFLSAYAIAVKHGYSGTEEEWLESLRGPEGQQGIQGKPGPQGAPGTVSFDELTEEQLAMLMGPEGKQGVPGMDGVGIQSVEQTTTSTEDGGTNVVTVTKTDGTSSVFQVKNGSKGSEGPAGSDGQDGVSPSVSVSEITGGHRVSIQDAVGTSSFDVMDGKDGKDGQSGAAGADGTTPTIGANGNWYVGQTDTGVPATGPAGPALTVTNTAAVGQTVRVTAVNDEGQPTEWEAVDMPEQVQADWNQNDSTSADYVKNRTHYEESTYVDYILNRGGTPFVGLSMPEVGETMTVKINGVESTETVKEAESSIFGASYKYIGNIDFDSLTSGGTGWCVAEVQGHASGLANPDTTITIETIVVHKINNKFINFDGFVRTFDYYFKGNFNIYKTLYDDNGNECSLYVYNNIILPEVGSQLLGFMGEVGFSKVDSIRISSCFVTGFIFNMAYDGVVVKSTILGTDTSEMEELAAEYGYVHTTNPKA